MHFFNPATAMPVVELVTPARLDGCSRDAAESFLESCGKRAVVVPDRTGFVVNRVLFAYLSATLRLLDECEVEAASVDALVKAACGFSMGPVELLDVIGLDTSLAILESLHRAHPDGGYEPTTRLRQLVAAGALGAKTGGGLRHAGGVDRIPAA